MKLTPNQLVAYNLARLRRERGWTQEEAAESLEPHLGVRWSKAVFSQAERSVLGTRSREFTADDLVAFARAFEAPLAWFFMPPDVGDLGVRRGDVPEPDLLDLLFGGGRSFEILWPRLHRLIRESPPALRAKRQGAAGAWIGQCFRTLLEAQAGPLNELAGNLMSLGQFLVSVSQQAVTEAVEHEVGRPDREGTPAPSGAPAPTPRRTRRVTRKGGR